MRCLKPFLAIKNRHLKYHLPTGCLRYYPSSDILTNFQVIELRPIKEQQAAASAVCKLGTVNQYQTKLTEPMVFVIRFP